MEPEPSSLKPKLRLICSHGGRIMPLPPENILYYIGGETRFVVIPRGISLPAFFELLSHKLLSGRSFSLKYRLPGCDLDSLITVFDNEDLQNMIAEYDSITISRIRLFLFPSNPSDQSRFELTRNPLSVNQLLGLEPPVQEILYNSSCSVVPLPIFPPDNAPAQSDDHGKVNATTMEENRKPNEAAPTTTASSLPSENTLANGSRGGRVLDIEAENVENQDQAPPMVQQQRFIICYVPILQMQPHIVNHPMAAYTLSPATEYASLNDSAPENQETAT